MNDIEQFQKWWVKYSAFKEYKGIVVLDGQKVVGYGSLQIKRNSKRISGVISEFLVDYSYPSLTHLLHKILFTLEQLSRYYQCTESIV